MRQTEIFWVFKTTCRFVSPNCAELGFVVAIGSKSRFGEFGFFFYLFFILFYLKFFVWLLRKFCSDFLKPKKVSFFVVVDVNFSFLWIWLEPLLCLSDIWMNFCTVLILISRFSNYLTDWLNLTSFFWSIGLFRMKYFKACLLVWDILEFRSNFLGSLIANQFYPKLEFRVRLYKLVQNGVLGLK